MNKNRNIKSIFLFLFCIVTSINATPIKHNGDTKCNYSNAPATRWQDALVSGNGSTGILVYGNPADEKIIVNHEMLYEFLGTEDVKPPYIANVLPKAKELIKNRHYAQAKQVLLDEAVRKGHTELLWTDPYHPGCLISLHQIFNGSPKKYKRVTDYNSGEITVDWQADKTNYKRSFFVSRPQQMIAGKIESSKKGDVNVDLKLSHQMEEKDIKINEYFDRPVSNIKKVNPDRWKSFSTLLVNPAEYNVNDKFLTFRVSYQVYDRGYEVVLYIKNHGGHVTSDSKMISVRGADKLEVYAKIYPIEPYSNSQINSTKEKMMSASSYDNLLSEHKNIHSDMFNRVELTLDKSGFKDGSNEELIRNQKKTKTINAYLLEKMFNMGIYSLISSSGNNPPNLMGIWNGEWRPAWSGDFTTDANINLQISAANLANLPEAIDSYMKLLERIAPDFETNAMMLFGCRGYNAGSRTSGRRGYATHFFEFPANYWTAGAEWLLLPCFEYYLCTGNKEFLHKRLFPMMEKVALFYEDFLDTYDENGKYLFAPSYSPENEAVLPDGRRQDAVANATMDIAAAKEALTNIIWVCEKENINHPKITLWKSMLAKFPPYLINKDGALKEWAREDLGDYYDHRHISHLYPVWPGLEITKDNPRLFNAACVAIEKRGRGNGSAHGLAHTALIASRLKMPELVYGNLHFILSSDYLYNSLFTSHNPNKIYNADALHSFPAVIMEMLVFSRPGEIELIPALSDKFPNGEIKGVMCRTQAKVKTLSWNMNKKSVKSSISSFCAQDINICLRKEIIGLFVNGKRVEMNGNKISIHFEPNETKEFEIRWK